jgi:hypothetical protein
MLHCFCLMSSLLSATALHTDWLRDSVFVIFFVTARLFGGSSYLHVCYWSVRCFNYRCFVAQVIPFAADSDPKNLLMELNETRSAWVRSDLAEALRIALSAGMKSNAELREVARCLKSTASMQLPTEIANDFLEARPFLWKYVAGAVQEQDHDGLTCGLDVLAMIQGMEYLPIDPLHDKLSLAAPINMAKAIKAVDEAKGTVVAQDAPALQ